MVILANRSGTTDGALFNFLSKVESKLPIVLVTRADDFVFNEDLKKLNGYVLVNGEELGWDGRRDITHFFGSNSNEFGGLYDSDEWRKFDDFIVSKPPTISFIRELLKDDESETTRPIEYPSLYQYDIQTKEAFFQRPIEVFFNWGLSNPSRPKLHGEIWSNCDNYGYIVCDNFNHIRDFLMREQNPKKWLTINTPHYARMPMENVMFLNGLSKISVSLFGAGRKCFRSTEAPCNSIMALPEDNLAWTFEWINMINCIRLTQGQEVRILNDAVEKLDKDWLYSIYVSGVETCNKYFITNYTKHIESIINNV